MDFMRDKIGNNKQERMTHIYDKLSSYLIDSDMPMLNVGYSPVYNIGEPDHLKYGVSLYLNLIKDITTEGKSLLDISCGKGVGVYAYQKYANFSNITGVDFNSDFIDSCRLNYPEAEFEVMNAEDIKYPDNSFDIITNVDSSFGYVNYDKFYKEVVRLLKPNGIFLYADGFTKESRFLDHSRLFKDIVRTDLTKNAIQACVDMNKELNNLDLSDAEISYLKYANDDNIEAYKASLKFIKYVCYI
jgi:ubiquinone/menaquinone biosynthesis C-methylase UbiE